MGVEPRSPKEDMVRSFSINHMKASWTFDGSYFEIDIDIPFFSGY